MKLFFLILMSMLMSVLDLFTLIFTVKYLYDSFVLKSIGFNLSVGMIFVSILIFNLVKAHGSISKNDEGRGVKQVISSILSYGVICLVVYLINQFN